MTLSACIGVEAGERFNFNAGWLLKVGETPAASTVKCNDKTWQKVTLPYAWNQHEAYSKGCGELSDTIMWYRKHFVTPKEWTGKRIFIEFEGVRFGARVFINGHEMGWGENGVMAFGFELTPYIKYGKENVLAVFVDNDWKYREHNRFYTDSKGEKHGYTFQWNDKNFFCNYGGINKRVWLHVMNDVYQTLPLYNGLGTTGTYIYARDIELSPAAYNAKVQNGAATIHAESQVVNSSAKAQQVEYSVSIHDMDGKQVAAFRGDKRTIAAGDTVTLSAERYLQGLHLWSVGYGYLYTVKTMLSIDGKVVDTRDTRTGFRKTEFKDGMFRLNGRVLHLKGFAQRSTNEWPALGISVPEWLSDYSNAQVLGCNGNFFRWMHVTPSKQDIESFDRMGLIQAMPAGDAEKDVNDHRWTQRCEVMRDAIIYNRNNPSIIFYEGGNNQISEEHMAELKAIRDQYDPFGGRASGSRNMQASKVAEYGGEMLYVNKSATKPMWQMEYNRDEGIRRYWDEWSYPYHKEGEGPLYRGQHTKSYNHNQDGLAIENIIRWNEYWLARPGTGKRVNSGGAKIIFSDSNTHSRGEKNYRTSGDMDAMRLPKDSYFAHQVMWNGWVDTEQDGTYIIGHWNYETSSKPVYVCSTGDEVELFLKPASVPDASASGWVSLGKGKRSDTFLFTFDSVKYEPGTLRAVSYKNGKEVSHDIKETIGEPVALRMRWIGPDQIENEKLRMENSAGASHSADGNHNSQFSTFNSQFFADGSDVRLAEIEAIDAQGRRHPLAHDVLHFSVSGNGTYIGGVSGLVSEEERKQNAAAKPEGVEGIVSEGGHSKNDNSVGSPELALEAGVIRVFVRSTTMAGKLTLTATPQGDSKLPAATLTATTEECPVKDGFYVTSKQKDAKPLEADRSKILPSYLANGETAVAPSYTQKYITVPIANIEAAVARDSTIQAFDDNETTTWSSDGLIQNAWMKVNLQRTAELSQVVMRVGDFRNTSYPIEIVADGKVVWSGYTQKSLGHVYCNFTKPVITDNILIRMIGEATVKEAFGSMTELAAKKNVSTKASKSNRLRITELECNEKVE